MGVTFAAPTRAPARGPEGTATRRPPGTECAEGRHGLAARALRAALRTLVLFPLLHLFADVRITGADRLPEGPVLVVANHASHADTVAVLRALPRRLRGRLAPAAAEDYFFRGRVRGCVSALLLGAFAFPRRGPAGLDRAAAALAAGRSVLLFPQGTRRGGDFRPGAGMLAAGGATVVPVAITGTDLLLPPGARLPHRAAVSVTIGAPRRYDRGADPAAAAADLQAAVAALRPPVRRPPGGRSLHARARALAGSRAGVGLVAFWAATEALVVPVVPDLVIGLLAAAAPHRWWRLAAAGVAGTVVGGAAAHALGAAGLVPPLPLVTGPMAATARELLADAGAAGVWAQPLSAVPFKAFAFQAADLGVGIIGFLAVAAAARGARMLVVAGLMAGLGAALRRWCPPRALPAVWAAGAGLVVVLFALGLAEIVLARR